MAEYVRNTVIPSKIDEKTVIDDIVEKIYLYQNINSKPNCTLEIEGKIGKIVLNDNKFFDLLKTMEKLSTRNYININEININKRFESGFNEELYYKNLNYFENVYNLKEKIHFSKIKDEYLKIYLEHFNQIKEEITLDFVSGNKTKKSRITYRLFDNSYEFLEKTNLIHFDILHNRYRMSLNKEEKFLDQKIDLSELEKSNLIRIKHRKIFYFQYMEYDFTHVLQINPNHNQIEFKNIIDFINDHSKLNKYILCLFSNENLIKKSTYEIEIEINNKDPYFAGVLNKPDGRPEATKLIQRFFRNLESLYMHDFHDIFFQNFLNPEYFNQNQQFIPNIRTPNPIVGNYMINEAYDHWKNILKG